MKVVGASSTIENEKHFALFLNIIVSLFSPFAFKPNEGLRGTIHHHWNLEKIKKGAPTDIFFSNVPANVHLSETVYT